MQVDKIYTNNINIQTPQTTENTVAQAESSARESSIETSVYNQKGLQLPFCGLWSMSGRFEQECIRALQRSPDETNCGLRCLVPSARPRWESVAWKAPGS